MTAPFTPRVLQQYRDDLAASIPTLHSRLSDITTGRVAPAVDDLAIGSARKVSAAVLFFDIRGFTAFTGSADDESLNRSLFMLNCVIPMMMRVLFRHGAYVEKNTGDGLMAVLGVETSDSHTAINAVSAATEMFYVLQNVVNPVLQGHGIRQIDARIGIDLGRVLLARIGLPRGSSAHDRSTLTAVGPAANIACKLQALAGTNEIWCGDKVRANFGPFGRMGFENVTPQDWNWTYSDTGGQYHCWRYIPRPQPLSMLGDLLMSNYGFPPDRSDR